MSIRTLPARLAGGGTRGGGLPADRGFIQAFLERGYRELRVDPPRALVACAAARPWRLRGGGTADVGGVDGFCAFARPGYVLIATSFELEALGDGTRLSTETRVQPTDAAAARAFRLVGDPRRLRADPSRRVARRAAPGRTRRDLCSARDAVPVMLVAARYDPDGVFRAF